VVPGAEEAILWAVRAEAEMHFVRLALMEETDQAEVDLMIGEWGKINGIIYTHFPLKTHFSGRK
jgi:hypothetical protein